MTPACDVLIIGAGPAGSASAIRLAQAGLDVVLTDRATFPREKPCSEYLGPGAVRQLAELGVLPELVRRGARVLRGTQVHGARGGRLTGMFAEADSGFPAGGLAILRTELDHALLDRARAAGARVQEGWTATALRQNGDQIEGARFRTAAGTREISARVTIGADGLRSLVARRLGGVRAGRPRRYGFVTHVSGIPDLGETATMLVSDQGYLGINPLAGGIANIALVVPAHRARHAAGRLEDFFEDELRRFPAPAGRIATLPRLHPVTAIGPFAVRAHRVTGHGALLVGDAADFFDPFTGEGIYTALAGAGLAAPVIVRALAVPGPVRRDRLRPYLRARWRCFLGKWAVERMIGFGMLAPRLFDRAVARMGRRGRMAHTLIGVTADMLPARAVLNPLFLTRMVL